MYQSPCKYVPDQYKHSYHTASANLANSIYLVKIYLSKIHENFVKKWCNIFDHTIREIPRNQLLLPIMMLEWIVRANDNNKLLLMENNCTLNFLQTILVSIRLWVMKIWQNYYHSFTGYTLMLLDKWVMNTQRERERYASTQYTHTYMHTLIASACNITCALFRKWDHVNVYCM